VDAKNALTAAAQAAAETEALPRRRHWQAAAMCQRRIHRTMLAWSPTLDKMVITD